MEINTIIDIIGIAWFASLITSFYVNRAVEKGLPLRKPFSCEKCLSFWIALIYFLTLRYPILQIIIFASITSLTATLINSIIRRVNR